MRDYDFYTDCFQTDWEWQSRWDKSDRGHVVRIAEQDIPNFVAEQTAKFTRYIMANLCPVAKRKDFFPFDKVGVHYNDFIVCPHCGEFITEEEWNESENIYSECPACLGRINMKED